MYFDAMTSMYALSSKVCIICCVTLFSLGFFFPSAIADDWDQGTLYVSPSHGPVGTEVSVSVSILNDVEQEYWDSYYGLEYKIVWDVRPADIINPNLWGWENPIGTAVIDYDGLLTGSAIIPNDEPGTYYIYAAYQRSESDPYHVYWWSTFTIDSTSTSDNDYDNDGLLDGYEFYNTFDTDGDGQTVGDIDELLIFSPYVDFDNDGIVNVFDSDSDNDGVSDYIEFRWGSSQISNDTDLDGISDFDEITATFGFRTSPVKNDTDGDTLSDYEEI